MIYKSLHEIVLDHVSSKAEKQETEYNPWHSENMNSMFHYRAQSITKIALAMAAPFIGAVFLVMERKQSPLDNSKVCLIKYCKARY